MNLTTFSCTCPHHSRKLRGLPLSDPHRLCKHLIQVLAVQGIPDIFKAYDEDIIWFAKHNASFTDQEKALVRERTLEMQFYREGKKLFTPDMITVFSRSKKRKYYYLDSKTTEKEISATMTLNGGDTSLHVNNLFALYSFSKNTCSFPDPIRFMAPGIILWLDMEYSAVTGDKRERSDTNIKGIYEQMLNPKLEIPMGTIITTSRERKPGKDIMTEWGEWTEEDFNCSLVRGHAEVNDRSAIHEPTEVEVIIPSTSNMVLFRINLSSCVESSFQETNGELIFTTSSVGRGNLNGISLKLAVQESDGKVVFSTSNGHDNKIDSTTDSRDADNIRFPPKFNYTKRAIEAWLEEEIRKARTEPQ